MPNASCSGLCSAGYFGNTSGLTIPTCNGVCVAGYYCLAGSTNGTAAICSAGQYSLGTTGGCTSCAAGQYGATTGLNTTGCSGNCSAGYYCPTGSTSATQLVCPPGQYSTVGSPSCPMCPAGQYGNSSGLPNATCSGPCAAGYYGSTVGRNVSTCSGPCTAGYFCVSGSLNATAAACPPGQYSNTGSGNCTLCPAGLYGATYGLNSSACSGNCTAGWYCPIGSSNTTQIVCPAGQYSVTGSSVCTLCAAGQYGNTTGLPTAACSGPCNAGTYGGSLGLTISSCNGSCAAGYYCPPGSTRVNQTACPLGQYSLGGAGNCTLCDAGRYGSSQALSTTNCSGLCAAGYYGATPGLNVSTCSGPCAPGYICSNGSLNATTLACSPGQYSLQGSSACTVCPAGQYGLSYALGSASCSGACTPGHYCPAGSVAMVRGHVCVWAFISPCPRPHTLCPAFFSPWSLLWISASCKAWLRSRRTALV